jgi:hypothetical protein
MNRIAIVTGILASLIAVAGCATERYAYHDRGNALKVDTLALMTKGDVIALSKAGIGDSVIISMLDVSGSYFQLKTQDVVDLKNAGVSEKVISAMLVPFEPSLETGGSRVHPYYYPPYYWWADYPFWYPPLYVGFSAGYYRPFYFHRIYSSHSGFAGYRGFYGGHGAGGSRSGGRHR